jgi:hypothetical protein
MLLCNTRLRLERDQARLELARLRGQRTLPDPEDPPEQEPMQFAEELAEGFRGEFERAMYSVLRPYAEALKHLCTEGCIGLGGWVVYPGEPDLEDLVWMGVPERFLRRATPEEAEADRHNWRENTDWAGSEEARANREERARAGGQR